MKPNHFRQSEPCPWSACINCKHSETIGEPKNAKVLVLAGYNCTLHNFEITPIKFWPRFHGQMYICDDYQIDDQLLGSLK